MDFLSFLGLLLLPIFITLVSILIKIKRCLYIFQRQLEGPWPAVILVRSSRTKDHTNVETDTNLKLTSESVYG